MAVMKPAMRSARIRIESDGLIGRYAKVYVPADPDVWLSEDLLLPCFEATFVLTMDEPNRAYLGVYASAAIDAELQELKIRQARPRRWWRRWL